MSSSNGSEQMVSAWGPGIDNLLAMTVYSGSTGTVYTALTDYLGTVHALADSSGSIVESYRFDAFGRVLGVFNGSGLPISQSAIGNSVLWGGKFYSWKVHAVAGSGFYYNRARCYDGVTGLWLSNDPIGISGGLNQYVFCGNNPVMGRDPDGEFWRYFVVGAVAVVGVVAVIELVDYFMDKIREARETPDNIKALRNASAAGFKTGVDAPFVAPLPGSHPASVAWTYLDISRNVGKAVQTDAEDCKKRTNHGSRLQSDSAGTEWLLEMNRRRSPQ